MHKLKNGTFMGHFWDKIYATILTLKIVYK